MLGQRKPKGGKGANYHKIFKSFSSNLGKRKDVFEPARNTLKEIFKSRKRTKMVTARRSHGIAHGRVYNEGTGGQCSYFTGVKGKSFVPSHVENALAPQVLQNSSALQLLSTVGLQNATVALELNNPIFAANYASDKISRVIYDHATGDVTLNNVYLSNCYIIIYDVFARKDVSSGTIATPLSAWSQGNTDEGTSNVYKQLGSTPWQSECFNQYWRVAQTTNVVLCAGGTHVHKVRLSPKKIVSAAYATYTPNAFKDLTYFCMIEIHGSPANDTMVQNQVSVGVGGLNIVVDSEMTLKQLQNMKPSITTATSLVTSFTNGEQVVNLGGSTIVAQAEG